MKQLRIIGALLLQALAAVTLFVAITTSTNLYVRVVVGLLAIGMFVAGQVMIQRPKLFIWLVMRVPLP